MAEPKRYPVNMLIGVKQMTLPEIIAYADLWGVAGGAPGPVTALAPIVNNGIQTEEFIPVEDFYRLDARFEELFTVLDRNAANAFYGEKVSIAYEGWAHGLLELPSTLKLNYQQSGETNGVYRLQHIDTSEVTMQSDGNLCFLASYFSMRQLPGGEAYCYREATGYFIIPPEWLNQHCPQWQQKLDIAVAMGMPKQDVPLFVFGSSPNPPNVDATLSSADGAIMLPEMTQ